jgi:hypothetical protein
MMTTLQERTMLAALHIGTWSGLTHDRDVTAEVSETHNAASHDAGRYTKQLISRKYINDVNKVAALTRATHRVLTLPWEDNGCRILACRGWSVYTEQMRFRRYAFDEVTRIFCRNYDAYVEEAKPRLGTMFKAEDFPTVDEVRAKFSFDVEIKPVPQSSDFRSQLSNESVKAITDDIERRCEERVKLAVNDVFLRIMDVTAKMTERLRLYRPAEGGERVKDGFHDSLVHNVSDLADLLPLLNITNDDRIERLQADLMALTTNEPKVLRTNEELRTDTADLAEALFRKAQGYLA